MLAPDAQPEAPGFQVALLRSGHVAGIAGGAALPLGLLPRCPGVRILPARHVEFRTRTARSHPGRWRPAGRHALGREDAAAPISLIVVSPGKPKRA